MASCHVPNSNHAVEADNWMNSYHITWIDNQIGHFSNRKKIKLLVEIDSELKTFDNEDEGVTYLQKQSSKKQPISHMVIISGALSQTVIPLIQTYQCIFAIFVYCRDADAYKDLEFDKLQGIYTDFDELLEVIEMCTVKLNERTTFNFFVNNKPEPTNPLHNIPQPEPQRAIRNLKENQANFIWYFQMQDFMVTLDNDDDEEAKKIMIEQSRLQFNEQSQRRQKIDEYENQTIKENKENAIINYTQNSFIYECVNIILRKENIAQVYCFRFIIKLISQQLKILHRDFVKDYRAKYGKETLRVYRGQCINSDQIETLLESTGSLISLNGFVSTSRKQSVAKTFIERRYREGCVPIIFKIDINMNNDHDVAFADISHLSRYAEEEEVLLSIGTVFHVDSIEQEFYKDGVNLYIVHLSLKQHNQLIVIKYIESTYGKNIDQTDKPVLFGKLLFEMGEPDAALTYFKDALKRLSDRNNKYRPIFLNNIGVCYNELKKPQEALKYYKKALEIYKADSYESGLIGCQLNIASIYHALGDNEQAKRLAEDIIHVRKSNRLEQASCHNLIGCIYMTMQQFDPAYASFSDTLEIRSKYYRDTDPDHPDVGVSHHNLGKACEKLCNFIEAKQHYRKAEQIFRRNYADNHPLVIEISDTLRRSR